MEEDVLIVIMDGQSNSIGVGDIASLPDYLAGCLTNCFSWKSNYNDILRVGVNQDSYAVLDIPDQRSFWMLNRFGYELELAFRLQAEYGKEILIIKTGRGGTVLFQTDRTNFNPNLKHSLHDRMIDIVNAATTKITADSKTYKLLAYVFTQGEDDALNNTYASAYQASLTDKINAVRTDLSDANLLVIDTLLPSWLSYTFRGTVNSAKSTVQGILSNIENIDTDTLTTDDNIHFDTDGLISLGDSIASSIISFYTL